MTNVPNGSRVISLEVFLLLQLLHFPVLCLWCASQATVIEMNGNANSSFSRFYSPPLDTQSPSCSLFLSLWTYGRLSCLTWNRAFHLLSSLSYVRVSYLYTNSFPPIFAYECHFFHLLNLQSKLCYQQPILNIWQCRGESAFSFITGSISLSQGHDTPAIKR